MDSRAQGERGRRGAGVRPGGRGGEVGEMNGGQGCEGRGIKTLPEPGEKTGEADASGGNRKRGGKAQLPDVEEAEPVSGAIGSVDFAEEGVRATGAREGSAQLGPDQAVGHGDGGAQQPGPDGEMKSRGGDDEGQGDEGPDADHLKHVEENGGSKADAALKSG